MSNKSKEKSCLRSRSSSTSPASPKTTTTKVLIDLNISEYEMLKNKRKYQQQKKSQSSNERECDSITTKPQIRYIKSADNNNTKIGSGKSGYCKQEGVFIQIAMSSSDKKSNIVKDINISDVNNEDEDGYDNEFTLKEGIKNPRTSSSSPEGRKEGRKNVSRSKSSSPEGRKDISKCPSREGRKIMSKSSSREGRKIMSKSSSRDEKNTNSKPKSSSSEKCKNTPSSKTGASKTDGKRKTHSASSASGGSTNRILHCSNDELKRATTPSSAPSKSKQKKSLILPELNNSKKKRSKSVTSQSDAESINILRRTSSENVQCPKIQKVYSESIVKLDKKKAKNTKKMSSSVSSIGTCPTDDDKKNSPRLLSGNNSDEKLLKSIDLDTEYLSENIRSNYVEDNLKTKKNNVQKKNKMKIKSDDDERKKNRKIIDDKLEDGKINEANNQMDEKTLTNREKYKSSIFEQQLSQIPRPKKNESCLNCITKREKQLINQQENSIKMIEKLYYPSDRKPKILLYNRNNKCKNCLIKTFQDQTIKQQQQLNKNQKLLTEVGELLRDENGFVELNYKKIIRFLKHSCPSNKIKLLQAIRWRITKYDDVVRDKTLNDIAKYDILGFKCECSTRSLLEDLLWPLNVVIPHSLQNCTARLFNAIASTKLGREYIGSCSIINLLVWGENTFSQPFEYNDREYIECHTTDMLIASMMKLSLNNYQRKDMVRKGLLKWLLNHLEDIEFSGSPYHIEYGTALLMMLLTFHNSSELIYDKSRQLLALLARFLNNNISTCWPYVRASLMALFRNYKIVNNARFMNFDEVLRSVLKTTDDPNDKLELESIINCLTSTSTVEFVNIENCVINLAEEKNYLDKEIEADDDVIKMHDLGGEELLEKKFSLKQKTVKIIKPKPNESHIMRNELVIDADLIPKSYNETSHTFEDIPSKLKLFSRTPLKFEQSNLSCKRYPSYTSINVNGETSSKINTVANKGKRSDSKKSTLRKESNLLLESEKLNSESNNIKRTEEIVPDDKKNKTNSIFRSTSCFSKTSESGSDASATRKKEIQKRKIKKVEKQNNTSKVESAIEDVGSSRQTNKKKLKKENNQRTNSTNGSETSTRLSSPALSNKSSRVDVKNQKKVSQNKPVKKIDKSNVKKDPRTNSDNNESDASQNLSLQNKNKKKLSRDVENKNYSENESDFQKTARSPAPSNKSSKESSKKMQSSKNRDERKEIKFQRADNKNQKHNINQIRNRKFSYHDIDTKYPSKRCSKRENIKTVTIMCNEDFSDSDFCPDNIQEFDIIKMKSLNSNEDATLCCRFPTANGSNSNTSLIKFTRLDKKNDQINTNISNSTTNIEYGTKRQPDGRIIAFVKQCISVENSNDLNKRSDHKFEVYSSKSK